MVARDIAMRSSACCRRYAALLAIVTNVRKSHIPGKRHSAFVVPGFAAIIFWFHAGCGLGLRVGYEGDKFVPNPLGFLAERAIWLAMHVQSSLLLSVSLPNASLTA